MYFTPSKYTILENISNSLYVTRASLKCYTFINFDNNNRYHYYLMMVGFIREKDVYY